MKNEEKKKILKQLMYLAIFSLLAFVPALIINYSINGHPSNLTVRAAMSKNIVLQKDKKPEISIEVPVRIVVPISKTNKITKEPKKFICNNWRKLEQGFGSVKYCEWK